MPNKKSAFKRLRQDKKKHISNKAVISELRTIAKKTRALITASDSDGANAMLRQLESKLDKAAKSNIIKKNTASRRISRIKTQCAKTKAAKDSK